jgi:arginyl-tRNA--protein-N-Asp/Glu arginylyltransferase
MKDSEFLTTMNESYNMYKRYQMTIHKESESDSDKHGFINFLVESPLKVWPPHPSFICTSSSKSI